MKSYIRQNQKMNTHWTQHWTGIKYILAAACLTACVARSQTVPGLPEPGLIMYGSVTNSSNSRPVSVGGVNWNISGGGSSYSGTSTVAIVNGQFFYITRVPFETRATATFSNFTPTPNTLPLPPSSRATFIRSATVNNQPATLTYSSLNSLGSFNFGPADRGLMERVDMAVSLPVTPETYAEWAYRTLGNASADPNADPDHDGMSNYQEYLAGTDPLNASSLFIVTDIRKDSLGGVDVRWQSVTNKTYTVLRSSDLRVGFFSLQTAIAATPATNVFHDATATGIGPYFYRVALGVVNLTNAPSDFKIIDIRPDALGGIDIRWQSFTNRSYSVYRSTNLKQGFINLQSGIAATPQTNTFRDATATGSGPYYYRVMND